MEHFREHTAMFNGLLDNVFCDIVSQWSVFSEQSS